MCVLLSNTCDLLSQLWAVCMLVSFCEYNVEEAHNLSKPTSRLSHLCFYLTATFLWTEVKQQQFERTNVIPRGIVSRRPKNVDAKYNATCVIASIFVRDPENKPPPQERKTPLGCPSAISTSSCFRCSIYISPSLAIGATHYPGVIVISLNIVMLLLLFTCYTCLLFFMSKCEWYLGKHCHGANLFILEGRCLNDTTAQFAPERDIF